MPLPKKILIANRGTAATRIARCCSKLGIPFVTVYSLEDCDSLHVNSDSVCLHESSSKAMDTYLNWDALFKACDDKGCDAIHPGYGFLSENADFASECEKRGIIFIGPTPEQISSFGLKHSARALAEQHGVPLLPGTGLLIDVEHAKKEAKRIGYPVLLKCVAGGGGIGMKVCEDEESLISAFDSVKRLAKSAFKDDGVFLEKFLPKARHVEVQIFGDGKGNVVALGERDCSTQRRNQKVIEESPAPYLTDEIRQQLWASAVRLAKGVGYRSAGTIEYVVDAKTLDFFFLEVNTRVQVEHGVTEQVFTEEGESELDIIEWMILTCSGDLDLSTPPTHLRQRYHSIQCRIYAEDANKDFQPAAGSILTEATFPPPSSDVRIETWVRTGVKVSALYDPMVAKLIVRGKTREEARFRMLESLSRTRLSGVECNVEFLEQAIASTAFQVFKDGLIHTHWLKSFEFTPRTIDVLEPGTQSSIQDYPGRIGYWAPGVPPSGPMDHFAFRVANRLVGNLETSAGLEMTLQGATLKFNSPCLIALTGADMEAELDDVPIKCHERIHVSKGSVLKLGSTLNGCRTYLAVSGGGFDVPTYLGSKSTFALGNFGGHAGRVLIHGDVLHMSRTDDLVPDASRTRILSPPKYSNEWTLRTIMGPHSAPDFFSSEYIQEEFLKSKWTVHYNSNRLGIRLSGPKPKFTRLDGGEAGLHPSNIHDTVYAIGTVNFTGDMPVILGLDGPSLGGFVCPVTVIKADLWKIGQLRPGDSVRFILTTYESALEKERAMDRFINEDLFLNTAWEDETGYLVASPSSSAILRQFDIAGVTIVYRQAGDHNILIEYGPLVLDLKMRCRVHALMCYLEARPIPGIIELSPGVRSLQVQFDSRIIGSDLAAGLLDHLERAERTTETVETMKINARILHLPLSFEASTTFEAIRKYRQSVRDEAPWLPSNTEFIRRINGLDSHDNVRDSVFSASFMVLGLGDVYLGAPCAVPLDPRHRLMTTKYNPARTWTAEGEVGIGGVFMCIYGMNSPGGYQLIGRTVPIWSNYPREPGAKNWLLRSFDQVHFYTMPESELDETRRRLARGEACPDVLKIEPVEFVVKDYLAFLDQNAAAIEDFQTKQRQAFEKERDSWPVDDAYVSKAAEEANQIASHETIVFAPGERPVRSQIAGNVWSVVVKPGDRVKKGDVLLVVEAMKLEINVASPYTGNVKSVFVHSGSKCSHGDLLVSFEPDEPVMPPSTTPINLVLNDLSLDALHELYFNKQVSVSSIIKQLYEERIRASKEHPYVFITTREEQDLMNECARLDSLPAADRAKLPLFGIPFACKDNIDCAGIKTTCACPEFAYVPKESSTVVRLLQEAGAVLIGKSNLDQFAAGLVGVRSPYGACRSVFNKEYVSGGSSSGSAVAVASKMVTFSLGTDTAGSGRVPAMFNGLVGVKPTRGLLSIKGVIPACKSLDCVSIFTTNVADADRILNVVAKFDSEDSYSRTPPMDIPRSLPHKFRFAIPAQLEFFGDEFAPKAFHSAIKRLESLGGEAISVDFSVFSRTAALLYEGPWVAERLEAIEEFVRTKADAMHPVTRSILTKGDNFNAVSVFRSLHELQDLKRKAASLLESVELMVVPTAPRHYKVSDLEHEPVKFNSNLGVYTNFVNLLDLCALAVPTTGVANSESNMPYGVTLIASAFHDRILLDVAARLERLKTIDLAVVGAHLDGMPLNYQLVDCGATLVRKAFTSKGKYKLFALNELKPGMIRSDDDPSSSIEVEIYRFPSHEAFGKFVSEIGAPLGVGTIEVHAAKGDGVEQVRSFMCEQYAVANARDITSFGGWRAFKRDMAKA